MTNRYTNVVLTVIAACLLILVLEPLYQPRQAHAQPTLAQAPADEILKVNIVEIAGWELLSRSTLPVEIESGPVPVVIQGSAGRSGCGCP